MEVTAAAMAHSLPALRFLWPVGGAVVGAAALDGGAPSLPEDRPPQHHYFEENCSGSFTFSEREITYSINESGMRERPAGELEAGQVLVLGDSMTEGWGLNREEALPALLEMRFRKDGLQFLNGGLRSTGTVMQSLRGQQLMERHRPSHILWVLTGNDAIDDRFAYGIASAFDSEGVPTAFSTEDFSRASWVNSLEPLRSVFRPGFTILRYLAYRRSVESLMRENVPACAGIRRLEAAAASRGVTISYVALPLGPFHKDEDAEAATERLLACVDRNKITDLRDLLGGRTDLYFPQNTHLNAEGTRIAADAVAEDLERVLGRRE